MLYSLHFYTGLIVACVVLAVMATAFHQTKHSLRSAYGALRWRRHWLKPRQEAFRLLVGFVGGFCAGAFVGYLLEVIVRCGMFLAWVIEAAVQ